MSYKCISVSFLDNLSKDHLLYDPLFFFSTDPGDKVGGDHALVLAGVEGQGSAQPPHLVHHGGVEPPEDSAARGMKAGPS